MTSSMPTSCATARAVVSLSPVRSTGRRPSAFSEATASAELSLTVSATTNTAVACPSQPAVIAVCPRASAARRAASSSGPRCIAQSARSAGRPTISAWPSTTPSTPRPSRLVKPSTAGSGAFGRGRPGDGLGDRVLGGVLERSDEPQRLVAVDAVGDRDLDEAHLARRHGAGLVEHDRVHAAGGFQDLGALDEQAELGAAAGTDHQRRGRGEPERARAGDDEDRDGRGEREARALAGAQPEAQGGERQNDDDRHEDARDAVGEALDRRLAGLGVLDEPRDLRQGGVGADLRGAHDQAPAGIDGGAGDLGSLPRPRRGRCRDDTGALVSSGGHRDLAA